VELPVTLKYQQLWAGLRQVVEKKEAAYVLEAGFAFDLPVLGRVRIAAAQGWLRMLPRTLPVSVQEEVQEKEQGPGTGRTLVIRRRS
jgi:hypothetical protein